MRLCALSLLLLASTVASSSVVVPTSLGPVEGTAHVPLIGTCASFYGVPYAAAPIGDNRFKPPQPASPWTDTRKALKVGRSCLQTFGDGFINLPPALEKFAENHHIGMEPMDEDCLFLNVFTPKAAEVAKGEGLPVMVWFHGGSYLGGSGDKQSGIPFYDGHDMCKTGDVVVVTVNYRLGIFGFFAHGELLKEEGTAGNMGIQDQRASLQWVQDNAHHFGGDMSRVTIFGESAGAGSVANHLLSPRSAPLFSAGIMQSGGLWLKTFKDSVSTSNSLAKAAGCDPKSAGTLQCMRKLNATTLLHNQLEQHWQMAGPCADGFEQPVGATQRSILASGNFTAKPMIVGTNRNESALFECLDVSQKLDEAGFRNLVATSLHINATGKQMDRVVSLYDASKYDGLWKRAYIDVATDVQFYCGSKEILEATVKSSKPAFQYRLDHTAFFFDYFPCLGVPHMTELFFLFGVFNPILKQEERDLGLRMRKHWAHFAYKHAPDEGWPSFGTDEQFLGLNTPNDAPGKGFKKEQCDAISDARSSTADDPPPVPPPLAKQASPKGIFV